MGILHGVRRRRDPCNTRDAINSNEPPQRAFTRLANGLTATAVGAYAFLDDLVLGPLLVGLAVWLPWWLTFGVSTAAFTSINLACCDWLERKWEIWVQGYGAKLESNLERKRRSRLLRRPVDWITRDSDVWITIAGGLIGTVIVFALARLAGGKPIPRRRVVFASLAYSVGFAATYTGVGVGIGDLVRLF